LNGKKLSKKEIVQNVGFVFQNPELHFFYDTIKDELKNLIHTAEQKEIAESFLRGISLSKSPFLLSEGEKRRLSLLLLVLMNKSFYFYDEPTFGQDRGSIENIVLLIKSLQKLNKLQLIISHDDNFINHVATKILEIKDKQLVEVGLT